MEEGRTGFVRAWLLKYIRGTELAVEGALGGVGWRLLAG